MPYLVARVPHLVARSGRLVAKLVSEILADLNCHLYVNNHPYSTIVHDLMSKHDLISAYDLDSNFD